MLDLTGQTLGQYVLECQIGRSGAAQIYRATQPSIARQVAIKLLPPRHVDDEALRERFRREVEIAARLQHPHIAPVYDSGEIQGILYIAMRYFSRGTLHDAIQRSKRGLRLDETVRIINQVATALDYAHQYGIIHRNVKPSNILLDDEGTAYLSDFGVARMSHADVELTGTGILGTPAYMAPETARPNSVTPLVDIYALGVTLYEMLTGQLPYDATNLINVLLAHIYEPIPNILTLRPDLPPRTQVVIRRVLAKEPTERYQSADEMAQALASVAHQAILSAAAPLNRRAAPDAAGQPSTTPQGSTNGQRGAQRPPVVPPPPAIDVGAWEPARPPERRFHPTSYVSPPTPVDNLDFYRDLAPYLPREQPGPSARVRVIRHGAPPPQHLSRNGGAEAQAPRPGSPEIPHNHVDRFQEPPAPAVQPVGLPDLAPIPPVEYSTPELEPASPPWPALHSPRVESDRSQRWLTSLLIGAVVCVAAYSIFLTLVVLGVINIPPLN